MLECPQENTGCWWDPLEEMKAYVASSYVTVREEIFDCFEAVANLTQCGGMSL